MRLLWNCLSTSTGITGGGIARKLTLHILNLAREDERIHTVVSVITGGNQASIHPRGAWISALRDDQRWA